MRKNNTTNANGTAKAEAMKKQGISVSSCSSSETEEEDEITQVYSHHHHQDFNTINKKSSLVVDTAPSIKSLQASQIKAALRTSVLVDEDDKQLENEVIQVVVATPTLNLQVHFTDNNEMCRYLNYKLLEIKCIIVVNQNHNSYSK